MAGSMGTPVGHLPVPNNPTPGGAEEDPTVTDVLREMEQEVAAATQRAAPPPRPSPPPMMLPPMQMQAPTRMIVSERDDTAWEGMWNPVALQRAGIAAAIALLLFYPATLQLLFDKVPALARFASYDIWIRTALLAVVLYVLMWKLQM